MKLFSYITGSEVFGSLSITDERRLDRLVARLSVSDSLVILCHSNVLLGLFPPRFSREYVEIDGMKIKTYFYVQLALSTAFLSQTIRTKLSSSEFNNRPVFYRRQILYVLKKLLRLGTDSRQMKPLENFADRQYLGRLLLNYANVLVPRDMEQRSLRASDSETFASELVLQLVPNFELDNPPHFDDGVARSLEYLRLFNVANPTFKDEMSLDAYFRSLTNVGLTHYLFLLTAVYFHFLKHLPNVQALINDPAEFNISATTYFANFDLDEDELLGFLKLTSTSIPLLQAESSTTNASITRDQYDFTLFRKFPLVFISSEIFTCIDLGFLAEKVSFGLFRTIHNALPDDNEIPSRKNVILANKLSSAWGKVIETYVANIFSPISDFCPEFTFSRGKGHQEEIDGLFFNGEDLIIVETKGGTLSAAAKYSGGQQLFDELDKKFGKKAKGKGNNNKGGVQQLAADIETLFPADSSKAELLRDFSCSLEILTAKQVFPVLIVEERVLTLDLAQWRLRSWFREELDNKEISPTVSVHPLLILPIDVLEWLEPHLVNSSFTFYEFVQFCSAEAQKPDLPFWEADVASTFERFIQIKNFKHLRNERLETSWNDFLAQLKKKLE